MSTTSVTAPDARAPLAPSAPSAPRTPRTPSAPMPPFDAAGLRRIEEAVREAERGTGGEIAVVIAPRSAGGSAARTWAALAVAALGGVALSRWMPMHAGWMALAVPALFVAAWLVAGLGPLARALAGGAALDAAVARAAKVAFLDHGVHATATRAGVLVYLSLFERRVHVLGDAAVHAVVGDAGWASWAERIGGAMKTSDTDALIGVVRDVGAALARSFPREADDKNELPDAVRPAR